MRLPPPLLLGSAG